MFNLFTKYLRPNIVCNKALVEYHLGIDVCVFINTIIYIYFTVVLFFKFKILSRKELNLIWKQLLKIVSRKVDI